MSSLFTARRYTSAVCAVVPCLSVCLSQAGRYKDPWQEPVRLSSLHGARASVVNAAVQLPWHTPCCCLRTILVMTADKMIANQSSHT